MRAPGGRPRGLPLACDYTPAPFRGQGAARGAVRGRRPAPVTAGPRSGRSGQRGLHKRSTDAPSHPLQGSEVTTMKRAILSVAALGLFALTLSAAPAADPSGWERLAPAGADFEARLPGKALEEIKTVRTPAGPMKLRMNSFMDLNSGVLYGVLEATPPPVARDVLKR